MALVFKDRVKETTATTGTGTITLAGAVSGFQSFAAVGNANTTHYAIVDSGSGAWEVGVGTYTASGTTLSRDAVLSSSNGDALVDFGAGSKDVFVTYPSEYTFGTAQTLAAANGGTGLTSPGTSGNVLTSNGTGWTSAAVPASLTGTTNLLFTFLGVGSGATDGGSSFRATAIGYQAARVITTAQDTTAVGYQALFTTNTGRRNTTIGSFAGYGLTNGNDCVYVGYRAGYSSNSDGFNVGVGNDAGFSTTSGTRNSTLGHQAGRNITTGIQNVILGADAANSGTNNLTTGSNNILIGFNAAATSATVSNEATVGNSSIATYRVPGVTQVITADRFVWGSNANLASTTGIALGSLANQGASGASNICIGSQAGRAESGNSGGGNVFIGNLAGVHSGGGSSPNNVGVGGSALRRISAGGTNTAVGFESGDQITTGIQNVTLGAGAASSGTNDLTTGSNNILIGFNAAASSATVSNEITLGNSSIATLRCQVTTITSLSDARDKTNIVDLDAGLNLINAVRPVAFDWNMRDGGKVGQHDTGFIAQELQSAQTAAGVNIPGLVLEDTPEKLEAGYGKLLPVMVKAIQELSAKVDALQAELNQLKGT